MRFAKLAMAGGMAGLLLIGFAMAENATVGRRENVTAAGGEKLVRAMIDLAGIPLE